MIKEEINKLKLNNIFNQNENELIKLKIQIIEYKNIINKLKKENTDLNNQLMQALELNVENNQLKTENNKLKKEKQQLSEKIQNLEKEINNYNLKIANINIDLDKYKEEINSLNQTILKKDYDIKELKLHKLSDLEKGEIMILIFTTLEKNFYYPIICEKTDIFKSVENKFYEKYPAYKESKNIFTAKGININENKSLEENKIENNDIITLKKLKKKIK